MSRDKFEAVRTNVAALNERDVDRYLACCTADVELVPATGAIEGGYIGRRGIERFFADLRDAAADFQVETERLEVVRGNVLAFERGSASGRASEVPGQMAFTTVYEFEGSRIRRIRVFLDREQALEAVGLRE
ncbi:MAG: nuclear transport factor 2 family protein [Solirubrobacteraceae bacterium]